VMTTPLAPTRVARAFWGWRLLAVMGVVWMSSSTAAWAQDKAADGALPPPDPPAGAATPQGDAVDAPAAPEVPLTKHRVWVSDVTAAADAGVPQTNLDTASGLTALFASRAPGLEVISSREVRQMMAMEAQRSAAGCTDTACMAEMASALDVELMLTGQMSRLGPVMVIHLSLIDVEDANTVARTTVQVRRSAEMAAALRSSMKPMLQPYGGLPDEEEKEDIARTDWAQSLRNVMASPDAAMFGATYVASMGSMCGLVLPFVPILQGLAFLQLGEDLAGRDYPNWWASILAGYGAYAVAVVAALAGGLATLAVAGGQPAVYVALAVLFFGIFVFEPLVAWGGGVIGARDLIWEEVQPTSTEEPPPAPAQALGFAPRRLGTPWVGAPPLLRLAPARTP